VHGSGGNAGEIDLGEFLAQSPPFDSLDMDSLHAAARAARIDRYGSGELIVDAFEEPTVEIFVVLSGEVSVWHDPDRINQAAEDRFQEHGVFGFSAMLTERAVGPRVVAHTEAFVARIPAALAQPAFSSLSGARFLAEHVSRTRKLAAGPPVYTMVHDLVASTPLRIDEESTILEVARQMTERGQTCVVVDRGNGCFAVATDTLLRREVLATGRPTDTRLSEIMLDSVPTTPFDESAAEALIRMLDAKAEYLLVIDRAGTLHGIVEARDFLVAPTTAGVAVHEQIRRAPTIDALIERAARVPSTIGEVLDHGLASSRAIAVYSAMVDAIIRRSILLVFESYPDLSVDAFTWLSLGSNGRREATLASDVDAAVAFDDSLTEAEMARYRLAFERVCAVIAKAGIKVDANGATPARAPFARTNRQWRQAAAQWLANPERDKGAVMASLLADARPIHGDPGLPETARVFADFDRHPATMELFLKESLSHRARYRSIRDVLAGRGTVFNIKTHALMPIVNIARWAGFGAESTELPTTDRLRAASGSVILPRRHAEQLIEAFEVLQRLRLRHQLTQIEHGDDPSDVLTKEELSPIDRSVVTQTVRQISAIQRRMDGVAANVPSLKHAVRPRDERG
jgi:CBS domain-containing protein